jgi:hypothetical protein
MRYAGKPGHVESYFLRANDPERPRAIWLKATVYAPLEGRAEVESWLVAFDGSLPRPIAGRESAPLSAGISETTPAGTRVTAVRMTLDLSAHGRVEGTVRTREGEGRIALSWQPAASPVGAPLSLLRPRILLEGPFPRLKFLTPFPALLFSGAVEVADERFEMDRWPGMQGHNWGREHAYEYAWGQCLFPGPANGREPDAMLEGFSGRVRVAGLLSPRVSCLVLRRGERTMRFDRLVDLWRQDAVIGRDRWTLRMSGVDGEARLEMDGAGRPMACLRYRNPDGEASYCHNTKLARVLLQVQPSSGPAFECRSEHGGALELLRHDTDTPAAEVV